MNNSIDEKNLVNLRKKKERKTKTKKKGVKLYAFLGDHYEVRVVSKIVKAVFNMHLSYTYFTGVSFLLQKKKKLVRTHHLSSYIMTTMITY